MVVLFYLKAGDVVVSMGGQSLLRGFDLRWAHWRGVTIVTVFLGSDSRPPYLNGAWLNPLTEVDWKQVRNKTRRTKSLVARAERVSNFVVCSPSTAQFLTKPYVNWFAVGMPSVSKPSIGESEATSPDETRNRTSDGVVVVHAPSRPIQKGTKEVERCMEQLTADGLEISYVNMEGSSNNAVKAAVARADLVIDEMYSDTFMGGLGAEAAAHGTACLTFGLAAPHLDKWMTVADAPLDGYAPPEMLLDRVKWAIANGDERRQLGARQRSFYEAHWRPIAVARTLTKIVEDRVPSDWRMHPTQVDYIGGFGMPAEMVEEGLHQYIQLFGWSALGLDDKPNLLTLIAAAIRRSEARHEAQP